MIWGCGSWGGPDMCVWSRVFYSWVPSRAFVATGCLFMCTCQCVAPFSWRACVHLVSSSDLGKRACDSGLLRERVSGVLRFWIRILLFRRTGRVVACRFFLFHIASLVLLASQGGYRVVRVLGMRHLLHCSSLGSKVCSFFATF